MADLCCSTLRVMTLTQEDLRHDLYLSEGQNLDEWEPLVVWTEQVGAFVIGNVAIFHCPWCGTQLPTKREEALSEAKKRGIWVDFAAPSGRVEASVDGVPVDPDKLLADLQNLTKDQD